MFYLASKFLVWLIFPLSLGILSGDVRTRVFPRVDLEVYGNQVLFEGAADSVAGPS